MDSSDLLYVQHQKGETIHRTKQELAQANAPLVSLADKEQLLDPEKILDKKEQQLRDFRNRVEALLPPEQEAGEQVGNVRQLPAEAASTYISITSGHSIAAMKEDLFNLWKYQRYNGKDSEDMQRLKRELTGLTDAFPRTVTFANHEDIRQRCGEMHEKYQGLIDSCEVYLAGHKHPWTIAGKARKSMAEKLLQAARAELDMLEDSAFNCFEEAKALHADIPSVRLSWDEILHHGKMRTVKSDRDNIDVKIDAHSHTAELVHRDTGVREVITYARDAKELEECRKVVAMSRLAQKLGIGALAGGGEMNTRMTTMIVNGKVVVGCITSGVTKKTLSDYRQEDRNTQRPGAELLPDKKTAYGPEHLKGLLAMPFLDYLCGVELGKRKEVYGTAAGELLSDKTETARGPVLGQIQGLSHRIAEGGFGKEAREFPDLGNAWMTEELANNILQLNANDVDKMLVGLIGKEERQALTIRLQSLKDQITAKRAQIAQQREGAPVPNNFKTDDDLKQILEKPNDLAAYAQSQSQGLHRLLDENIARNGNVQPESANPTGLLLPLEHLIGDLREPVGKNKEALQGFLTGLTEKVNQFAEKRNAPVSFEDGAEALQNAITEQLEDIQALRQSLKNYLKKSADPEDFPNRMAVGKLLGASEYQEQCYRAHVDAMYRWVERLKAQKTDRTFSFTYDELFKESMFLSKKQDRVGEFALKDLYKDVELTEQELCEKTETESYNSISTRLFSSLDKRNKDQKKNSPEIMAVYDKLLSLTELESRKVNNSPADMITALTELYNACSAYIDKQESRFAGGKFSSTGRDRLDMVEDLQALIEEEIAAFGHKAEDGTVALDENALSRLADQCVTATKPKEDVTFNDISLLLKRRQLLKREEAISQGSDYKTKERVRLREKKKAQAAPPLTEEERARMRASAAPPTFSLMDPLTVEKQLATGGEVGDLHSYSERLDGMLEGRKKNSPQIIAYADQLAALTELKDMPIFRGGYGQGLQGLNAEGRFAHLNNPAVDRLNQYIDAVNELTRRQDAYMEKQNSRIFGGTVTGQARMDLIRNVHQTCVWEVQSLMSDRVDRYTGRSTADTEKLVRYIEQLLSSGKPLDEITFTDITNLARLEAKTKESAERTRPSAQVPAEEHQTEPSVQPQTQQTEAEQPVSSNVVQLSSVPTLQGYMTRLNGAKKALGRTDSIEYQAVKESLTLLLHYSKGAEKSILKERYQEVVEKCDRYLEKSKRNNDRRQCVAEIRLYCLNEDMQLR